MINVVELDYNPTRDSARIIHENFKPLKKNNTELLTAIIIDDSLDIVELFSDFLEMQGIKILGKGYNAKDAVELYEKLRPDVVFLDIMMPDYDGFYALDGIRKINQSAKVMMVTEDLRQETADNLDKYESIALVYKPFDFDTIMQVLDELMRSDFVDSMAFQGSTMTIMKKQ
jgi:two-component system chemotaxis response regulator CheY